MPTLNWLGKDKIINCDKKVSFKVLNKIYSYGEKSDNMIIHGDNLEGLKSLLLDHKNSIQCIYIDPPYNTGKPEGTWVYSDNLDYPQFKKWLNKAVARREKIYQGTINGCVLCI